MGTTFPARRANGLLVEALADETIVYDTRSHEAHCLGPTASLVWSLCDGRTTVAAMAGALRDGLGIAADERLVRLTLGQLERLGLLERDSPGPAAADVPRSRRELARLVAAYGIPALVMTIASPKPAAAASCLAAGQDCVRKGVVLGRCCTGLSCSQTHGNAISCQ